MTLRPGLLVLAAVPLLLLSHAQSMVVASDGCLTLASATQEEDNDVMICGFPQPAGIGSSPDVPFACHRKTDSILGLLSSQPGLQTLTAENICYQVFFDRTRGPTLTLLSSTIVARRYSSSMQLRLLASVAKLVGITQTLFICGRSFSAINPEIFSAVGSAQNETLKKLVLCDTNITSIDLALLEPLDISILELVNNTLLSRITNSKNVTLPSLKELVIRNGSKSLLDCHSFPALPAGLTTIQLLQKDMEGICALCFLPKSVTKVFVEQTQDKLPFHPLVVGNNSENSLKEFLVTPNTATGCQPNCSCQSVPTMSASSTVTPTVTAKPTISNKSTEQTTTKLSASSTVTEVYIVVLVALIIFGIFL